MKSPAFLFLALVLFSFVACGPSPEAVAARSYWDNLGRAKNTLKQSLQAVPVREFPQTNGVIDLGKCSADDFKAMVESDQQTQKIWLTYADAIQALPRTGVDPLLVDYAQKAEAYARKQVESYRLQEQLHQFIMQDRQTFGGQKVTKENVTQINANIAEINRLGQAASEFAARVEVDRPQVDTAMNATKDAMIKKYVTFQK